MGCITIYDNMIIALNVQAYLEMWENHQRQRSTNEYTSAKCLEHIKKIGDALPL